MPLKAPAFSSSISVAEGLVEAVSGEVANVKARVEAAASAGINTMILKRKLSHRVGTRGGEEARDGGVSRGKASAGDVTLTVARSEGLDRPLSIRLFFARHLVANSDQRDGVAHAGVVRLRQAEEPV